MTTEKQIQKQTFGCTSKKLLSSCLSQADLTDLKVFFKNDDLVFGRPAVHVGIDLIERLQSGARQSRTKRTPRLTG